MRYASLRKQLERLPLTEVVLLSLLLSIVSIGISLYCQWNSHQEVNRLYKDFSALFIDVKADGAANVYLVGVVLDQDTGKGIEAVTVASDRIQGTRPAPVCLTSATGHFALTIQAATVFSGRGIDALSGLAKAHLNCGVLYLQKNGYERYEHRIPSIEDKRKKSDELTWIDLGIIEMKRSDETTPMDVQPVEMPER